MATATALVVGIQQFADQNGLPLAGGHLYSYQAGTTTPQALYTDVGLSVPYPNPIVLDSAGTPGGVVYMLASPAYKLVVTDSNGVQVLSADNLIAALGAA